MAARRHDAGCVRSIARHGRRGGPVSGRHPEISIDKGNEMRLKTTMTLLALLGSCAVFGAAQATTFTRNSPAGGTLPSGVTEIGGVVVDLIGSNHNRVVSELPASDLFVGYCDGGTPSSYDGNPCTI